MRTFCTWFGALALAVKACPWISEVHADPNPLPDTQGEFIEIAGMLPAESLFVLMDSDTLSIKAPTDSSSPFQVFCHVDTLRVLPEFPVACALFTKALPNSHPLQISLVQGSCRDTAFVEAAQAGFSWQRTLRPPAQALWQKAAPTPGFANISVGDSVENAWVVVDSVLHDSFGRELWLTVHANAAQELSRTDLRLLVQWQQLGTAETLQCDTLSVHANQSIQLAYTARSWPWVLLHLELFGDAYPLDNHFDTLLVDSPPLRISEVAPCPAKPWPEWFEVENEMPNTVRLLDISPCRSMLVSDSVGVLGLQERALVTDSRAKMLAAMPGLAQVSILQTAQSLALANSGDTLRLCWQGHQVDSVLWKSLSTSQCGQSFQVESDSLVQGVSSPGWKSAQEYSLQAPILLSRIVSKKSPERAFQLRIPFVGNAWTLDIAAMDGTLWLHHAKVETPQYSWTPPAQVRTGPSLAVLRAPDSSQVRIPFVIIP